MMNQMRTKFHFFLLLQSALFMRRSSCSLLRGFPDENTLQETSGGGAQQEYSDVSPRIIDGYNVEEEDRYPYFGMILRGSMCGSVLIGPDLVLSAAHCSDISDSVTIGVHDRSNRGATQTIGIEEQIIHPQYTRTSFRYDIMILKLEEKADTNQYAKINRNGQIPSVYEALSTAGNNNGGELTVIGFGDTTKESGDDIASILQETQVQYVEQEQCENVHGRWMIREDMLCAYGDGTDACYGDSGGPLLMKGEDASDDVVVGIVSWGRGCASGVFPGVYARVSYFYDWIVQVACDVSDDHPFDCTDAPSVTPSEMPSESPSSIPTSIDNPDIRINPVATFVGWTVSPSNPLQRCQGDCDNDDECEGDLVCFGQNGLSVPGCDGERERAIADYCVRPEDRDNITTSGDER